MAILQWIAIDVDLEEAPLQLLHLLRLLRPRVGDGAEEDAQHRRHRHHRFASQLGDQPLQVGGHQSAGEVLRPGPVQIVVGH